MTFLNKKIGFIGGGQMGEAIIKGLLNAGLFKREEIYVMDILQARLTYLQEIFQLIHVTSSIETGYQYLLENCDVILLAVKPQVLKEVLGYIQQGPWRKEHFVISIVGGGKTAAIEAYLKEIPVVRVIPNTPMLVNVGASGIALGRYATQEHGDITLRIFEKLGIAVPVKEALIDPITSVSGTGPAYVYMLIEALADGGVEGGLTREVAQTLAAQTVLGAAKMVLESPEHPERLKDRVCSPGGATIAGVRVLEEGGFKGLVMKAVHAGRLRMEEVGRTAD